MLEQYIYNKISSNSTLISLLSKDGVLNLYPSVIPRGVTSYDNAVTFSTISTVDVFPNAKAIYLQFNIFTKEHIKSVEVANALDELFNQDNNQTDGGINVIFSIRKSESDLGFNFDSNFYQREATYYFKIR